MWNRNMHVVPRIQRLWGLEENHSLLERINTIRNRNFYGPWSPWGAGWGTSELLKRRAMSKTYFFLLYVIWLTVWVQLSLDLWGCYLLKWHVLWSHFPLTSSSESGAGERKNERRLSRAARSLHRTVPPPRAEWMYCGRVAVLFPASASTPEIWNKLRALSPQSSSPLSSPSNGQWQVWTVDAGEKFDHKIMLFEHIKFPCSLGRWIFSLLWRMKN